MISLRVRFVQNVCLMPDEALTSLLTCAYIIHSVTPEQVERVKNSESIT